MVSQGYSYELAVCSLSEMCGAVFSVQCVERSGCGVQLAMCSVWSGFCSVRVGVCSLKWEVCTLCSVGCVVYC